MGTGAVIAGVALRRVRRVIGPRTIIVTAMIGFGMFTFGVALSKSTPLTILLIVPIGMGWLACFSSLMALVQLASQAWIKSRVVALYNMVFFTIWSVGATAGGVLADHYGERAALGFSAIASVLAGLLTQRLALPKEEPRAGMSTEVSYASK
jgi:MFS family permease